MQGGKTESIEEPQDRRESVEFWLRWIKAAKKGAKQHWEDAKDAWAEYENKAADTAQVAGQVTRETAERKYPIYWSSCKTIQPAYYARTPEVVTRRLFDIDDPVATTGCLIAERLSKHLLENCNFDETMMAVVQDFIHADKATAQVIYEADIDEGNERKPIEARQMEDGSMVPYDGESPYEGDAEILEENGGYYYEAPYKRATNIRIRVAPARYNKQLHTPEATSEDEITDRAYFFCLDYDEACQKFPDLNPADLPWKTNKSYKEDGEQEQSERADSPGKYLEGWECWSKKTKKVYFVCEGYHEGFLKDPAEDPYQLRKFFPSPPFVIGSRPSDSLYPTPAWIHLKPTAEMLHKCYGRIMEMVEGARRRAIVDEAHSDVIAALQDLSSGEFVTAKNLTSIVEKGGLSNLIQYLPVEELVKAIGELAQLEETFDAKFSQWFGVPDVLRGEGDPIETAAAQQIKSGAAHDRFKYDKRQIQRLARDLIEQMLDIAIGVYGLEELAEIVGAQYMQPQDQQNFVPAVEMLKNDRTRIVRIDIETDSTSYVDDQAEAQKRQKVGELLIGGLDKIAAISQTTPDFVPVALRTLLYGISSLQGGKEFEDDIVGAVNALTQKMSAPPQGPPPPSQEDQLKREVAMAELQVKKQSLDIEMQKLAQKAQEANMDAADNAQEREAKIALEREKLDLERQKIALEEREKLIEEQRLAQKQEVEAAKNASPRAVTINLGGGGSKKASSDGDAPEPPKRKRFTPVRDENGDAVAWDLDEVPVV